MRIVATEARNEVLEAYCAKVDILPMPHDAETDRAFRAMVQDLPEHEELFVVLKEMSAELSYCDENRGYDRCSVQKVWLQWGRGTVTMPEMFTKLIIIGIEEG